MVTIKKQNEPDKTQNTVHIEGQVFSCVITNKDNPSDYTVADLEVITATRHETEDGKIELKDKLFHRVRVIATGENRKKYKQLEKVCEIERNKKYNIKPIAISLEGEITVGKNNQPYVLATKDNISFSDNIKFKNSLKLLGKVEKTISNNHFATAILSSQTSFGKKILIPMVVFNKDNPKGWNDIASGKLHKGDIIDISGPLVSSFYGNGKDSKYRCSVNVKHSTILNQKLHKEKKKTRSLK